MQTQVFKANWNVTQLISAFAHLETIASTWTSADRNSH